MGVDFTVGYRALKGEVWTTDDLGRPAEPTGKSGLYVRRIGSWSKAPLVGADPRNLGSANRIDEHALAEGAEVVVIDATGMGSGVVDGLRDLGFGQGKYAVLEYYASGASTDKRAYTNARAQHYFALKDLMHEAVLDLDVKDELLFDELRGIPYEFDSRGAVKLVGKDEIRRKGGKSPDYADAVVYATADMAPLVHPLQQLNKGDRVYLDPYTVMTLDREGPGMPL